MMKAAASSKGISSGMAISRWASTAISCAIAPQPALPSTRWPTETPVTPSPSALTTPENSPPGENGRSGLNWYWSWMIRKSGKLTPQARISTTAWPALGCGLSTSSSTRVSGPPTALLSSAFIKVSPVYGRGFSFPPGAGEGGQAGFRLIRPHLLWPPRPPMTVTLDLSRAKPLASQPKNLAGMTRAQLQAALVEAGVCPPQKARMRTGQVWRWIHTAGHTDFERMTDIDKATRSALAETFSLTRPEIVERQVSRDGTRKWLLRTAPGIEIETVVSP